MSDQAEDPNMKGGHAPAVKAGGMRIVQHKQHGGGDKSTTEEKPTAEEVEEYGGSPPKTDKHHQSILLSGAVTKGDKDFPPEAVRVMHEKRQTPTHENRPAHQAQNRVIQQPRK